MKVFLAHILVVVALALTSCNNEAKREFVVSISDYSDYSTVDWSELSEQYYRPNTADWSEGIGAQIIEGFPMEIASEYWHILQNARTDFHQKSLPVRVGATASTTALLDKTEAMFDTVFVRCVSQEYYMRLFPEMYNEVMKPAITELTQKL
jgi:sulfur relay (sulfurtransferase) DsrC/TusE family protein